MSSSTEEGVEAFSGRRSGRAPDVQDFIGGYGGSIVHSDEDHLLQCFLANASSQSCGSQGDGPHRSCEQLRAIIGTGARGTVEDFHAFLVDLRGLGQNGNFSGLVAAMLWTRP